jgi:hypothetical protein
LLFATMADGLAELQVRWPEVPIVYCETRALAEEWTYRYLAAAHAWATTEAAAGDRIGPVVSDLDGAPAAPAPATADVRAWARAHGIPSTGPRKATPRRLKRLARRPSTHQRAVDLGDSFMHC